MVSTLHEPIRLDESLGECSSSAIDIIAVHGLCESSKTAWFNPKTGHNWLDEWLPEDLQVARILTFDYNSSPLAFFDENGVDQIERTAQTLVQNIQTHRSLEKGEQRPIVFICHGLGGVIVKKALIYSSLQTSSHVQHLYTVYVSTFAIVFFGVPHHALNRAIWLQLEASLRNQSLMSDEDHEQQSTIHSLESETLNSINAAFSPLMKQFRIFFLWEELKTRLQTVECFIVDSASAAPDISTAERTGIFANHVDMVKFEESKAPGYKSVRAAFARYCKEAPPIIARRWQVAEQHINQARSDEAYELTGMIYRLEDQHRKPSASFSTKSHDGDCVHLPRRPDKDFVERAEIVRKLFDSFWNSSTLGQKIHILYGMGGAGKTEIGIKFAKDNSARYSAVFTIDATDADKTKTSFAGIGKCGGLESTEKSGKYWLEQFHEPWLLIIDNADNPNIDLMSLCQECEHGHILVTTRNPELRRYSTAGYTLVGQLTETEALQLLLTSAQIPGPPWRPREEIAASKIVKALGYLALALKAAGTSIYRRICQIYDYLDYHMYYCNEYRSRVGVDNSLTDDEASTYAAFDISSRWLESDMSAASHDAVQILNVVAFFHFEHIPINVFHRAALHVQAEMGSNEPRSLFDIISKFVESRVKPPRARPGFLNGQQSSGLEYRLNKALRWLSSLSIIFYDEDDTDCTAFSLHPVIHTWARYRLRPNEQKLWARVALNIATDSISLPTGSPDDKLYVEFYRRLVPHLNSCLEASPLSPGDYSTVSARIRIALAVVVQPTLLALMRERILDAAKCGYLYLICGYFERSIGYLSMACSMLLSMVGSQNGSTTKAQLGLARAYWGLGRLDQAIDIQRSVVRARTQKLGASHCDTLLAQDDLARSYWLNGQYKEALELQDITVIQMSQTLKHNNNDLLRALDNLGVIYGSWHRFQESLEIHQRVLDIRREVGDADSEEAISTRMFLAMAMLGTDNLTEAQDQMTKVYEARKLQLGKEHPWTLWALCYLAKIKVKAQRLDDAEQMLDEGIAAGRRSLNDDHLGVLMGLGELARVYSRQGRLEKASALLKDTVSRLENSRGLEHPDHVYGLWKLAQLRVKQGLLPEAIEHCKRALNLANGRLTLDHPLARLIEADLDSMVTEQSQNMRETARAPD